MKRYGSPSELYTKQTKLNTLLKKLPNSLLYQKFKIPNPKGFSSPSKNEGENSKARRRLFQFHSR